MHNQLTLLQKTFPRQMADQSVIELPFFTRQKLLGVDTEKLAEVLTSTTTTTRGSVIKRRLKDHQAIG